MLFHPIHSHPYSIYPSTLTKSSATHSYWIYHPTLSLVTYTSSTLKSFHVVPIHLNISSKLNTSIHIVSHSTYSFKLSWIYSFILHPVDGIPPWIYIHPQHSLSHIWFRVNWIFPSTLADISSILDIIFDIIPSHQYVIHIENISPYCSQSKKSNLN